MIMNFFAHAGEVHDTTAEAAAHVGLDPVLCWVILLLVPAVIAFFTHTVCKMKLFNTLLTISVFLIAFSIYTYQAPGIYTFVSLTVGFGVVFVTTLLRLVSE